MYLFIVEKVSVTPSKVFGRLHSFLSAVGGGEDTVATSTLRKDLSWLMV